MKKTIIILVLSFCLIGCSFNNARDVLENIVYKDYPNSTLLCEKKDNQYYLAMLKQNSDVVLIILKEKLNGYEYFGSTSYDINKNKFGYYNYGDDNTIVIVFSNNGKEYTHISLNYTNINNKDETLNINDEINKKENILQLYSLPSSYSLENVDIK